MVRELAEDDREGEEEGVRSLFTSGGSWGEGVGEGRWGVLVSFPVLSLFVISFSCAEPLLFLWMGGVFDFFAQGAQWISF